MTAAHNEVPDTGRPLARIGGVTIDHVFLTRFNLPSAGPESLIRAQDGWLQSRVRLFERFTVPSVRRQTLAGSFSWIVYLDPQSPDWLVDRLAPLVRDGVFTPIYREQFTHLDVVADARTLTGGKGDILLTTNLDNDDALAVDFVERLHRLAPKGRRMAIYLGNGIILSGDQAYVRLDPRNAFCSVAEPWDGAESVWREWHNLLHRHMPIRAERGRPAWLQVVHGRNVSNRIRGRLVDPTEYRSDFPGLLEDVPRPTRGELLSDRVLRAPARETREAVRRVGKAVLLGSVGKQGLDRFKDSLGRRAASRRPSIR